MNEKTAKSKQQKILTIIGIVLCAILVPILILNCTLLIKSYVNKDEVPDIGGKIPFIVLSPSMEPQIKSGDIIICQKIDPKTVQVGDVISFYDPAGTGTSVVTHKVIERIEKDGKLFFRTQGINNSTPDRLPVSEDKVIAEYTGVRFALIGYIAIFMQTIPGLIVCVLVPMILLVGYDLLRRRRYERNKSEDVDALKAELEALKAAKAKEETAKPEQNAEKPASENPPASAPAKEVGQSAEAPQKE